MIKETIAILSISLSMCSFSYAQSLNSNPYGSKSRKVQTNDSVASVHNPILLADKVEIGKKLANQKKLREAELENILSQERLEYPAIDLYGENSWNSSINPILNSSVEIPSDYEINISDFVMPVDKRVVTSDFGYRRRFGRMHFGTDLDLNTGDEVRVAFDGKVRIVDYDARGYGHYVLVRHPNGLETIYAHLSKAKAKVGDILKAGDVLGLGGSTGRSTGSHLHFEVRFMGIAINPETLFDFTRGEPKFETFAFNRGTITSARGSRTKYSSAGYNKKMPSRSKKSATTSVAVHRIKSGETLSTIAKKYGVSVSSIKKKNNIKGNSIIAGKTLRIK